jgi:hypothetical protein
MVLDTLYIDICVFQPMEIYVDDETKLTLHGLVQVSSTFFFFQYYCFINCLYLAHSTNVHFHCLSLFAALHFTEGGRKKPQIE